MTFIWKDFLTIEIHTHWLIKQICEKFLDVFQMLSDVLMAVT